VHRGLQQSLVVVRNEGAASNSAKDALACLQVEAQLAFDWHWEKLGMQGSGQGELDLLGGDINYRFRCSRAAVDGGVWGGYQVRWVAWCWLWVMQHSGAPASSPFLLNQPG